jgi:hypothetical protein
MHITYVSIWAMSLILYEGNPRLHVCFDKMSNGPKCEIVSEYVAQIYIWNLDVATHTTN